MQEIIPASYHRVESTQPLHEKLNSVGDSTKKLNSVGDSTKRHTVKVKQFKQAAEKITLQKSFSDVELQATHADITSVQVATSSVKHTLGNKPMGTSSECAIQKYKTCTYSVDRGKSNKLKDLGVDDVCNMYVDLCTATQCCIM